MRAFVWAKEGDFQYGPRPSDFSSMVGYSSPSRVFLRCKMSLGYRIVVEAKTRKQNEIIGNKKYPTRAMFANIRLGDLRNTNQTTPEIRFQTSTKIRGSYQWAATVPHTIGELDIKAKSSTVQRSRVQYMMSRQSNSRNAHSVGH